ncbi:SDR family oxidoreductase [Vibrio sp. S9_S30]|uniref:SDR family oxidoreductase n=1 Tax=Vibrio sp. S9_S30 TaxID=2720226 RepID=UPI0016816278|nr:SDR family oxidoreductase [Vibrio sp. S9_S30]MBD1559296.1 SDR family oxidoreductase [Vibrio sp. S9_S30]
MPHVVITGANRGIGLALVKHYLLQNWSVTATYRNANRSAELIELAQNETALTAVELDVTDYPAVNQFAQRLFSQSSSTQNSFAQSLGSVDLLINNAGYYGPKGYGFGNTDVEEWRKVFEINSIAPLKLVEAFFENLNSGQGKTVVCISSKVGSMAENTSGGGYVYRSSKAAVNSVVKSLHNDLHSYGLRVVALHPGWVQTEMGGPNALITTEESAKGLYDVIESIDAEKSGGFYDYQGNTIPW